MLRLLQNTLLGLSLILGLPAGELHAQSGPLVEIQTPSLPSATVGVPYATFLLGNHGRLPYQFSIDAGVLPPGLTLATREQMVDVMISGIPTSTGTFPVTFRIRDSLGATNTRAYTIVVQAAGPNLRITTNNLPEASVGQPYNGAVEATGGHLPFTYNLSAGTLPAGLTMASNGSITGIPTVAGVALLEVRVMDGQGRTATAALSLTVTGDGLHFNFFHLPAGRPGVYYEAALSVAGGVRPYRFSVVSGSLPDGTRLSNEFETRGFIQGVILREANFRFRIRVQDATNRNQIEMDFTIPVTTRPFGFATQELPIAYVGQAYQFQVVGEGSNGPLRFLLDSAVTGTNGDEFPGNPDVRLSQTGEIRGVPRQAGRWSVRVMMSDLFFQAVGQTYEFRVETSRLRWETSALPAGVVGQSYAATLRTTGQQGAVRFSLRSGSPGEGLTLGANGELRGIPTRAGSNSFVVEAVDERGQTAQATLTLLVTAAALRLTTSALPVGMVGRAYSEAIGATGGSAPYTYSLVSGAAPGLALAATGRLSGVPTQAGVFALGVRVVDGQGASGQGTVELRVENAAPVMEISSFAPPSALLNFQYQFAFAVDGGRAPFSWRVVEGRLPAGLRLESDGTLRGMAMAVGTARFVVEAREAQGGTARREVGLAVGLPAELPRAMVGQMYAGRVSGMLSGAAVSGFAYGELPRGLRLGGNGELTGVPEEAGLYTFGVRGVNERGSVVSVPVNLRVEAGAGLRVETVSLAGGVVDVAQEERLVASGGVEPYRWELAEGRLPEGLRLEGDRVVGTPRAGGFATVRLRVVDGSGREVTRHFQMNVAERGAPRLAAVTSAASYEGRGVAPGEVLAVFGEGLGSRVLFDGVAGSVLYATAGQVGVVAPFGLEGREMTRVVVEGAGGVSAPLRMAVLGAKPGVFSADGSGRGAGAMLNQDGSVNGMGRRARAGEVVVVYLTGGGGMTPPGVDGRVATGLSRLNGEVEMEVGGQRAEVLYAGNAPGLVEGVVQMNVRIPEGVAGGLVGMKVKVGGEETPGTVGVWVE